MIADFRDNSRLLYQEVRENFEVKKQRANVYCSIILFISKYF